MLHRVKIWCINQKRICSLEVEKGYQRDSCPCEVFRTAGVTRRFLDSMQS